MSQTPRAVITGDLIGSREAPAGAVDAALTLLAEAAAAFGERISGDLRFTRFRGDGWQVYLAEASEALDAMLYLFARLRAGNLGVDTRMSLGIGTVRSTGTDDLSDADGFAFHVSGDHLDRMPKRRRFVIAGNTFPNGTATAGTEDGSHHQIGAWEDACLHLIEHLAFGWTFPQAEALAIYLGPGTRTQDDTARHLGITRQAAQSRLSGAGLPALLSARGAYRGLFRGLRDEGP